MSILLVACQFEYRTPNRVNKNIEVQYSTIVSLFRRSGLICTVLDTSFVVHCTNPVHVVVQLLSTS